MLNRNLGFNMSIKIPGRRKRGLGEEAGRQPEMQAEHSFRQAGGSCEPAIPIAPVPHVPQQSEAHTPAGWAVGSELPWGRAHEATERQFHCSSEDPDGGDNWRKVSSHSPHHLTAICARTHACANHSQAEGIPRELLLCSSS